MQIQTEQRKRLFYSLNRKESTEILRIAWLNNSLDMSDDKPTHSMVSTSLLNMSKTPFKVFDIFQKLNIYSISATKVKEHEVRFIIKARSTGKRFYIDTKQQTGSVAYKTLLSGINEFLIQSDSPFKLF